MSIKLTDNKELRWNWRNLFKNDLVPQIVDLTNDKVICELKDGHTDMIRGAMELNSGAILTWSSDCTLRVWDAKNGTCKTVMEGHKEYISEVKRVNTIKFNLF